MTQDAVYVGRCDLDAFSNSASAAAASPTAAVRVEIRATRRPSVQPCRFVVRWAAGRRCRALRRLSNSRSPTVSCRRFCTRVHTARR